MSSELKDVAGVRRILRWYPYSHPSRAAPGRSSKSSPTSPDPATASMEARSALSAFHAPRSVSATRSAPLEFQAVVRTEPGLTASRSELAETLLSKEDKLKITKRIVERAMNVLSSAWKIVEKGPYPVVSTAPRAVASLSVPPLLSPYDGLQYPYQSTREHMPLRHFVHEVVRRSRTNFVVLQTAMCYIEAVATRLPILVKEEANLMLQRAESVYIRQPNEENPEVPAASPLLCPRRTFLASILVASKFLQDRSYSNRSWAKLTGLGAREVGRSERALCAALDYRLWVGKNSEPVPTIAGLDMAPVIALSVTYQPEPERTAPVILRRQRSAIELDSCGAAVNMPSPHPGEQPPLAVAVNKPILRPPTQDHTALVQPLPSFKSLAAAVDVPVEGPSSLGAIWLERLPSTPPHAPTDLQPSCSPLQAADPDNAPSSSAKSASPSDACP